MFRAAAPYPLTLQKDMQHARKSLKKPANWNGTVILLCCEENGDCKHSCRLVQGKNIPHEPDFPSSSLCFPACLRILIPRPLRMLFRLHRKPILTRSQIERLSNIFDNAGQVALGAGVVAPLFAGIDKVDIGSVVSGIVLVSLCWLLSLWLAKRKDE